MATIFTPIQALDSSGMWDDGDTFADCFLTAIDAVIADLEAEGIDNPLAQSFTLAALVRDLCIAAGVTPPADVLALVA